ncbi:MAG: hypothetical protein EOP53_15100 [Sphingobacteriales bacterium]|nr:MAG: hypothetical protein EOP53_15100 [Sphingobacteriales bacterium]
MKYGGNRFLVDYYPKLKAEHPYRLLTNQNKFGTIGSAVLAIMAKTRRETGECIFGMFSAYLPDEAETGANKRFSVYVTILRRKVNPEHFKVFGVEAKSCIFVAPLKLRDEKDQITLDYEKIFQENY